MHTKKGAEGFNKSSTADWWPFLQYTFSAFVCLGSLFVSTGMNNLSTHKKRRYGSL